MIIIHHLNNSRSQRVLWLLEELELDYEIKRYQRDAATMLAPATLRAVHPLGKSPVLSDGNRTLAESGAIIEYVVERYGNGRLAPARGSDARLAYTYWLHYAEGSAMPPLLLKLIFSRLPHPPMPLVMRPFARAISNAVQQRFIDPQLRLHLDYMEHELAQRPWFAGEEFSAADIQMSFPLEAARSRAGISRATHPHIFQWVDKIHARPAYQAALAKGGPYAYS